MDAELVALDGLMDVALAALALSMDALHLYFPIYLADRGVYLAAYSVAASYRRYRGS